MSEVKSAYVAARAAADEARTGAVRANERVKLLQLEVDALARSAAGQGGAAAERLHALRGELEKAKGAARQSASTLADARKALTGAHARFAELTDPEHAVAQLRDDVPFALFPLRLETRFRTLAGQQHLLVRVFPDDALVDTFQPELAQAELDNVTTWWTHVWRAGGDVAGRKAAWAALVKSHGAGRAWWLINLVAPLDRTAEPVAGDNEHVLVIRPASPVPGPERASIAKFWERVWASSGAERDAAFADLVTALGPTRAAEVEATLAPVNLLDEAVKPSPSLTPKAAFLDLPDPATLPVAQTAWTRGARAWLLPDRLVVMGFRDGKEVLRQPGAPIPAELQIIADPSAGKDEQLRPDGEELHVPEALRWTVDFDTAVAQGMAFSINLTQRGIDPRFDRLFVLGVRSSSDATEGAGELSRLIGNHQASRKGFALLPQGRPTNNTDTSRAGYSWWEDPDESYRHFFETTGADPTRWQERKDGSWLAGALGLDPAVLRASPNFHGKDQTEARAMNVALWPGTLGYYLGQMMGPVFSDETERATRDFFTRFVTGRGAVPLVRIGKQPYGVLPVTAWSKMAWWTQPDYARLAPQHGLPSAKYLGELHALIEKATARWRSLIRGVAHVGERGANPHQTLLDVIGLHPGSAELYQRYSQSFTQHYNALGFATEAVSEPATDAMRTYIAQTLAALAALGWTPPAGAELPELLEKVFLKNPNLLKGELVDAELSETSKLSVTRADKQNYIEWLQSAARSSHDALRRQDGFTGGVPSALLYLMLHHALDLGFVDAGLSLRRDALKWTPEVFRAERREPKFFHVGDANRSAWDALYKPEAAVTGDATRKLGDFIPTVLVTHRPWLQEQLSALDVLKGASTASLERALVEHVDCLTYRLDAWRAALVAVQLSHMRAETSEGFSKGGVLIGAYGWVENLRPKDAALEPVRLDPELGAFFDDPKAPLVRDRGNFGHLHAPSLDQAVTAAILRNGHLANATPESPDLLAVDLSSERVRRAHVVIDGIRNGQSLGALLGYQLERALHDAPNLYLDRVILELRRAFPLVAQRHKKTRLAGPALKRITAVEARNVVDGEAFLEHLQTHPATYPYGVADLPALSTLTGPGLPGAAEIGAAIDRCVADMRATADAVADLGVAEGVYQAVRGNYERAAGVLDAFSKGAHPPVPEVTSTPGAGRTMTHRLALHLEGGLPPSSTRPREAGEPALARWLAAHLPKPANVFARVTWRDGEGGAPSSLTPSMADLGLSAADLFYLLDAGGARAMPGFDELLIDWAERTGSPAPRHDAIYELEFQPAGVAGLTLFELAPLVRAVRGLVLGARPLRPTDLSLQNEAGRAEDATLSVRADKAQAVLTQLIATQPAVTSFIATLEAAIGAGVTDAAARDNARDNVDAWMLAYAALVRPVVPFGLRSASSSAAVEARRTRFTALRDALDELVTRWTKLEADYTGVMNDYAALPSSATEDEKNALLIRAGRLVSTSIIAPIPPDLPGAVAALKTTFDGALTGLRALRDGAKTVGATLVGLTAFAPTVAAIDQTPLSLDGFRDSVLTLAQELLQRATTLRDDLADRVKKASAALGRVSTATGDTAQAAVVEAARAVLGESFLCLSEFTLPAERLAEWSNVWASRAALLNHLKTGDEATPFPIDDWLHGLARVRERPRHLERATLLGEVLGADQALSLEALQFPHRPNDAWLGMRFPTPPPGDPPFELTEDKLLYTAQIDAGAQLDPAQPAKTYSGLMLDEWVEVIPTQNARTGLAFHFDRPQSEAPQAILLATPPVQQGAWRWQDLMDTLHETLDEARLRAVEPKLLDETELAHLVPAVLSAVTLMPITAMLNFALNNQLHLTLAEGDR